MKKKNGIKKLKKAYKKTKIGLSYAYSGAKAVGSDVATTFKVIKKDFGTFKPVKVKKIKKIGKRKRRKRRKVVVVIK